MQEESVMMKKAVEANLKNKARNEEYYNKKSNIKASTVKKGDWVLVRQKRKNKLSTTFCTIPVKVKNVKNSAVIFEKNHKEFVRNINDVKVIPSYNSENESDESDYPCSTEESDSGSDELENPAVRVRPRRNIRLPSRFDDFVVEDD